MNLIQLIQMMKTGDPRQAIMSMLKGVQPNNPMLNNVINMVNNNDVNGIEQFARNLAKEKGIDVDKAIQQIMQQIK